ncbi:ABC transporter ATP-binding protein [Olivibacter ginsenosidimutans]|uniref:ABC transporter ATP-binding protein n=1 Tax=Olivibacter ginsenosidimutans TaxID=1176537 RepID=A0ABP9CBE5_9SPHI
MIKNLLYVLNLKRKETYKAILWELVHAIFLAAPIGFLLLILQDLFLPAPHPAKLWTYVGLMIGLLVLQLFVAVRSVIASNGMTYAVSTDLRIRLGNQLQRLSMGTFKQRDPGDLAAVLLQDVANFELIFGHTVGNITAALFSMLVLSGFLFITDWRLAIVLLAALPLVWLMVRLAAHLLTKQGKKHVAARNATSARFLEYVSGIRTIKSFGMTGKRFSSLEKALNDFRRASIRTEAIPGPFVLLATVVLEVCFLLMLWLGIHFFAQGTLAIPVLIAFLLMGYRLYDPIKIMLVDFALLRYMNISLGRVLELLQTPRQGAGKNLQPSHYDICFHDVSFGYHPERKVLDKVSFQIPEHRMTALVGPSGSGKTTITSLIARFWDVDEGRIEIGGIAIQDMKPTTVYSLISEVFQEVYLFDDTIYNNIKYGKPEATEAEIIAAAERACVLDFAWEMPGGLHSAVGENGNKLSGGQKQRISIARALLKDAPIVLLDEATASLDPENEIYIQQAIQELVKDKTVIVIAHKLATVRKADQLLVLQEGQIVERGSHGELMALGGLYRRLYDIQQQAGGWKLGKKALPEP